MVSGYFNPSVMDDAKLLAWINGDGARKEVTKSYYDETLITGLPGDFTPNVLTQRKRIVHVTYEEEFDNDDQTFDHATHYDYDIHGNVKTMLQDNRKMAEDFASIATQRFKRMDYTYDLVSGNVHRMSVQNGEVDQWHHAYRYDADNRITQAYTNTQTPLLSNELLPQALENELIQNSDWQQEASYLYYDHGPLARTEIGQDELQGCDYVYNLQGWIKGVNSTTLDETVDVGEDGLSTSLNGNFARDVYGFGLHYYQGDYLAINGTGQNHLASINPTSHAALNTTTNDLFNGNIRFMQTAITNPDTRDAMPMLNVYEYDQLNRLLESRSYETGLNNNTWNPITYGNEYYNAFTFDPNGNILTQKRHLRDGTPIEDMTYQYQNSSNGDLLRNRLYHINDAIASGVDNTDIDDMGAFTPGVTINTDNNYSFDEEGRLIRDVAEGIEKITWRVDGKVKSIERPLNSQKKNVSFDYDAMGNRIAKHVFDDNWMLEKSTYYILDASGNQLSMYEHEVDQQAVNYTLAERNIYGSSRIGRNSHKVDLYTADFENPVTSVLGEKFYEVSNHLGNVLAVMNDVKYPIATGTTVDFFEVGLVSVSDYSPFGVQLDGRTFEGGGYRYGAANGQEKVDEISGSGNHYTAEFWEYDPRIARRWNPDPIIKAHESPYAAFANNPIWFVDPNGADTSTVDNVANELSDLKEMSANIDKIENAIYDQMDAIEEGEQALARMKLENLPGTKSKNPFVKTLSSINEFGIVAFEARIKSAKAEVNQNMEIYNDLVNKYNGMVEDYKQSLDQTDALVGVQVDRPENPTRMDITIYPKVRYDIGKNKSKIHIEIDGNKYNFGPKSNHWRDIELKVLKKTPFTGEMKYNLYELPEFIDPY